MSEILPFVEDTQPSLKTESRSSMPSTSNVLAVNETSSSSTKESTEDLGTPNKGEVTSLSFEQVNDNADELIELRGEGRYFGVTDPSSGKTINSLQNLGPLCANCHKRGHIRAKCKTVVCHKCGVVGDHYETQCPTTMICSRCGLKGHIAVNCKNRAKKRQYCKHCDTFNHGDDTCPSIWRSYLTLPTPKSDNEDDESESTVLPVIYCYNCGDDKHYGDECNELRTSRIPNQTGSAFSGTNLPRHLRTLYFNRLNGSKNTNMKKDNKENKTKPSNTFKASKNNGSSNNYRNNYSNNYANGNFNNYNNTLNKNFDSQKYITINSQKYDRNRNPSRSGYIISSHNKSSKSTSNNSKQPTRTGYINPNKNRVNKPSIKNERPTRSGLIENNSNRAKKQKNRNIKYLY